MNKPKKCPECESSNLVYDESRSELICGNCGLIVEDKMVDTVHELRASDKSEKKTRSGAPISLMKSDGLSTTVGNISDMYKLDAKQRGMNSRISKWNDRVSTSIDRNLRMALSELRKVASFLELPQVVQEEASRVYRHVLQRGYVRGRSMESVIASCIYAACRSYNIPRTLDEISSASEVERKEIGRTYRFIVRKVGMKITNSSPKDYISRFSSTLHLSPKSQTGALDILSRKEVGELMSGRGPAGIAAATIYVAAMLNDEKKTQREVADVAGITEVTIRNRYKELLDRLGIDEKKKLKEKSKDEKEKEK